jgi:hypothetical protein
MSPRSITIDPIAPLEGHASSIPDPKGPGRAEWSETLRSYEIRAGEKILPSRPYRPELREEPFEAARPGTSGGA